MLSDSSCKSRVFQRAIAALQPSKNSHYQVLDFGCGDGEFLTRLSSVVGEHSHLVGYDAMEQSIARARLNYPSGEFICDKFIDVLPFPDASFDILVTIDTIECIKNRNALVNEFHRVLKPGGRLLAMHWDWDTQIFSIPSRELAREAISAFSDWKQPWMDEADGQMGRKLWGMFEGSNRFHGRPDSFCLIETSYEAGRYGYDRARDLSSLVEQGGFEEEKYVQFLSELSESSATGVYFYSVTSFIYHGKTLLSHKYCSLK